MLRASFFPFHIDEAVPCLRTPCFIALTATFFVGFRNQCILDNCSSISLVVFYFVILDTFIQGNKYPRQIGSWTRVTGLQSGLLRCPHQSNRHELCFLKIFRTPRIT